MLCGRYVKELIADYFENLTKRTNIFCGRYVNELIPIILRILRNTQIYSVARILSFFGAKTEDAHSVHAEFKI
jgi:hypothetical protein